MVRRTVLGVGAVTLAVVAVLGLMALGGGGGGSATVEIGKPAPGYEAREIDGDAPVTLEDFEDEVLLVNLWATWCDPCIEEMPFIEELHQDYKDDGLRVIGANIDTGGDGGVTDFLDGLGVTFLNVRDPSNDFQRTFRTMGVPETVLIDRDGDLVHRWRGPLDTRPDETHELVAAALEGSEIDASSLASVGLIIAFFAGMLSFLSPCVLPLVPTYLAVITGRSVNELAEGNAARSSTMANAGLFIAGFSLVFVALGASASAIGQVFADSTIWIARIGGVIVAIFGLHLLGVVRIPFLQQEARALDRASGRRAGRAGTFVIGMAFAAGWTPCIGPVLAAILTLSATSESIGTGLGLLSTYSVGMAIPFLVIALSLGWFLQVNVRIRRWLPLLERLSGVLCLVIAALLISGALERLNQWLSGFAPGVG